MRRRAWIGGGLATVSVALLVPSASVGAAARTGAAEPRAAEAGEPRPFVFAGGEEERAEVRRAIEAVVAEMSFIARPLARRGLLEANTVIARLEFSLQGDPVVVKYVEGRLVEAPRDGRAVPWTDQFGDRVRVSHRLREGQLVQTLSDRRGFRRNTYVFGAEGALTMKVVVQSSMLPSPLRYTLTYREA